MTSGRPRHTHRSQERGAILVLTALVIMILLIIAAFATDLGAWYAQGRDQQRSADIAALNGAQSYSGNVAAELDALGVSNLAALTQAQHVALETTAFEGAVADVIETLNVGGLVITDTPIYIVAIPPAPSTATVTAANGATITITRDPNGHMKTMITNPGNQYFSNLVRDAPVITRESTATISNCGADCTTSVEFIPPSTGFDASGKGDGYMPLVTDNGRVYAINHHAIPGQNYSAVCMVIDTETNCPGYPVDLYHYTSSRGEDAYDSARERVYFGAIVETTAADGTMTYDFGVECIDNVGVYCGFTPLAATAAPSGGQGAMAGVGVWFVNDQIFAVAQDGTMHCVEPDSIGTATPFCTGYPKDSAIVASGSARGAMDDWKGGAGAVWDDKIYISQAVAGWSGVYHCWDPIAHTACASFSTTVAGAPGSLPAMRFLRYNAAGAVIGFCTGGSSGEFNVGHRCVDSSGSLEYNPIPNLTRADGHIYGNGETFQGRFMYYSNFTGDALNCYDWALAKSCSYAHDSIPMIYGSAVLDDICMISLGHDSKFYTWDAYTKLPCGGEPAVTQLWPCICADGTARYGDLTVPEEIQAFLASVDATVTGGGQTVGPVDILNNKLDLSNFDGVPGPLTLELAVTSKVDGFGNLLWTDPLIVDVNMAVQPTLIED